MARKRTTPAITDFGNIPAEALVPEDEQPYEIRADWKWVRLEAICKLLSGRDEPLSECNADGSGIPYVMGASNLSDSGLTIERWIEHPKVVSQAGSLLISVKGTVGKLYVQQEAQLNLSRQIMAVEPGILVNVDYLFEYVHETLQDIQEQAVGLIPGITRQVLLSLPIPLPPIEEQKAIIKKLQSTNQKFDDVLERLDQFLDGLTVKQNSIIKAILAGRGSRVVDTENVPGSWRNETLGRVLRVSSGRGLTANQMNPEGEVPVYGGNGIVGSHDEACYPAGTIVIGRVGYYCGAVHMSRQKCWVTDNALVVRFDEEAIDRRYLFHLLAYTNLRVNTSSSAQPLISGKKIYGIKVRIPSLSVQEALVFEVERSIDQIVQSQALVAEARDLLVTTRRKLRQKSLRGLV